MADMKGAARTTMAARLIADVVKTEHDPVKADLLASMLDAGVERVRVADDDGLSLGAVSLGQRKPAAKLTDPAAFTAWVAQRYPDELVRSVRESFTSKLLAGATAASAPVDVSTGEEIPGVEMAAGEPYVTVRPTAEAKVRMAEMLRASGLLQITSGGQA
jgi:hypothetical protein